MNGHEKRRGASALLWRIISSGGVRGSGQHENELDRAGRVSSQAG